MKEQLYLHVHTFLRALFLPLPLPLQSSPHLSPCRSGLHSFFTLDPFRGRLLSTLSFFFSFMRDFFLQMKLYGKVKNIEQGCSAWRKCGTQEPHLVGFLLIPLAESSRSSKEQTFKPTALLLFVLSLLLIKTCQS